jgi:DNA polymerase-1
MNAAGFFTQAPTTLLNELRVAPWAAIDIRTTALTRFSRPIRVTRTSAIGNLEWPAYRAAHPDATLNSVPRARVLSVYTEALGHSVWDLDELKQEERLTLFEAAIDRKIVVGYNLGLDLSWLFGESTARPSFALDAMILFRQIRPAVLLRPYRWAGFSDQVKQQFAASLLQRPTHNSGSREYFAACAEMLLPKTSFESAASWCVSALSADHLAYAKSTLDLTLQFFRFLLPGASVEQMPGHIRGDHPWYVPFQTALVRLAEGHVRGAAFDLEAAGSLMTKLLAEIEIAANEVASYQAFAGLKDQLKDPHVGETGDIKRALAAQAAANGITHPAIDSGKFDRRYMQALGSDRVPVWPHLERLQSAKKAIASLEEYRDAARHDSRLHSLVSFTTVTGRTSSSEPSLQNVPRDGRFRRLFKARPGYAILAADYAAIELRIAAALADRAIADVRSRTLCGDDGWFLKQVRRGVRHSGHLTHPEDLPNGTQLTPTWLGAVIASVANTVLRRRTQVMASILQQGLDPHLVTAADFARRSGALDFEGHPLQWVSALDLTNIRALKEKLRRERQSAKAANFGLLYGMKEQGLHASGIRNFGLVWTLEEASEARRAWFWLYPELHLWHLWTKYCQSQKSNREKWRLWGFGDEKSKLIIPQYDVRVFKTTTLTGRPIAALNELSAALNYQAQGTGADILSCAIAALPEEIAAMMMMPVHDELVLEVPFGSVDAIKTVVEATMVAAAAGVLGASIPVVVETSVGQTWSDE